MRSPSMRSPRACSDVTPGTQPSSRGFTSFFHHTLLRDTRCPPPPSSPRCHCVRAGVQGRRIWVAGARDLGWLDHTSGRRWARARARLRARNAFYSVIGCIHTSISLHCIASVNIILSVPPLHPPCRTSASHISHTSTHTLPNPEFTARALYAPLDSDTYQ